MKIEPPETNFRREKSKEEKEKETQLNHFKATWNQTLIPLHNNTHINHQATCFLI